MMVGRRPETVMSRLSMTRFLMEQEDAKSANAIAYSHVVLSQIGLPRSPQTVRKWERSNGNSHLRIDAGVLWGGEAERWVEQPLPQGVTPRLILADVSTYAIRHRTRVIPMGGNISAYMRDRLNLNPCGRTRVLFRKEADALLAANVLIGLDTDKLPVTVKASPFDGFSMMWDRRFDGVAWFRELHLSERFYDSLTKHAAPYDMRAYRGLSHSALAQDIYTWLGHRLPRLDARLELPWSVLAEQFGGYANPKVFRERFITSLEDVQLLYPQANVSVKLGAKGRRGGSLILLPSAGPVRSSTSFPKCRQRSSRVAV
jgi:hypothetical protein